MGRLIIFVYININKDISAGCWGEVFIFCSSGKNMYLS